MNEEHFLISILKHLEVPFDYEEVEDIDCDALGNVFIDLKDGTSYSLSFQKMYNDDDYDTD